MPTRFHPSNHLAKEPGSLSSHSPGKPGGFLPEELIPRRRDIAPTVIFVLAFVSFAVLFFAIAPVFGGSR